MGIRLLDILQHEHFSLCHNKKEKKKEGNQKDFT